MLEGIFYVLRTGCQWKAAPREYGCGSSIHRYFQEWQAAGFFENIWVLGLEKYDELEGIGWKWQSVDGCMIKAPLARESVGHNPTDCGKMGTKRSVLTDEKGLPLSVVLSGANTHDIKLLEETLDSIIISRPAVSENHPQNLCLDAGYTGSTQSVEKRQYTVHIRPRGEERKEIEHNPDFRARRWVVEVTHSFFNRFRKLLRSLNIVQSLQDSDITIEGDSARAWYMQEFLDYYTGGLLDVAAEVALGTEDCIVKPYTDGKRLGVDIIKNNDFVVCESIGNDILAFMPALPRPGSRTRTLY